MPMTCQPQTVTQAVSHTVSHATFVPAARPRVPNFVRLLLNPINAHTLHKAIAAAVARSAPPSRRGGPSCPRRTCRWTLSARSKTAA